MSGLHMDSGLPQELHIDLDDVRHLRMKYTRARPDKIELAVEYVGGRVRVYEVDRFLIERLLEQLEYRDS
jgi:hypothetical protein